MSKNRIITVQNIAVTVSETDNDDYICITRKRCASPNSE